MIKVQYPWLIERGGQGSGRRDDDTPAKPKVTAGMGYQPLSDDQKRTVVTHLLKNNSPKQIKAKGRKVEATIKLLKKTKLTPENKTKLQNVMAMRDLLIAALKQS